MNRICICTFLLLILTACGGSSSSTLSPQKGVFIDSVVEGVTFTTATQSGTTDSAGTYNYLPGEIVSLYIGDILLGSAPGKPLMTPLDFVPGAIDETDQRVTNILRFIQSLDSDNDPDNGISISNIVATQAVGQSLDFSLATADFEIAANALISMLTSDEVTTLVDASTAQAHFVGSLGGGATVPPANNAPVTVDDGYTTLEDTPLVVAAAGILANDTDPDLDPLQALLFDDVTNGILALNADGSFTYTPEPNFAGTDSFTYTVADEDGLVSNPAVVTLTVTAVNDGSPIAVVDTDTVAEDGSVAINVLANDTDLDGNVTINPTTVVIVPASGPSNGTVSVTATGVVTYTPNPNYNGPDSFTYTVADEDGLVSNPAVVSLTVTSVNDGSPVAVVDTATVAEDGSVAINVLANDTDLDGNVTIDPTTVTIVPASGPSNGTVSVTATGVVTYTPNPNYNGPDSFTYTVADEDGLVSDPAQVTLLVDSDPDDLVRLLLDEGSGVIAFDDSYNDGVFNDGTLIGSPIYEAASGDGSTFSLRLDGVDDHIDLGVIDVVGPGLTLATWFNADSLPSWHPPARLISKSSGLLENEHVVFMLDIVKLGSASLLRASLRIGGVTTVLIAEDGNLISGVWYHAALTYDGTELRLFLDGNVVGSSFLSGSVDNGQSITVTVGSQFGGTDQLFAGRMDDVRISQRALTEDQLSIIVDGSRNQPAVPTTLSFGASPNIVSSTNGATTLNWNAPYATRCTASGAWSGIKGASGSESICSITAYSEFALTCSGPGGTVDDMVNVSVVLSNNGTALLSWTAPTENTDGSELEDLAGYKIYYGPSSGNYCNSITILISDLVLLDYLVEDLASSGWYFAMTAFNSSGIESDYSVEVSKTIE